MNGALTQNDLGQLPELQQLVGPYGVVHGVSRLPNKAGEPAFPIFVSRLGDLAYVSENVRESAGVGGARNGIDGAGGALDPLKARLLSTAEAIERYASCIFDERDVIWASYDEIADDAIDPRRLPQCSPDELSNPKSIHSEVDTSAPIRWAQGWSITQQRYVYVPAVSVWLHIPPMTAAERFTMPISTGCAAHTNIHQAVLSGMCEVIERDAIALTWLQEIPWPRLRIDFDDDRLRPFAKPYVDSHVRTEFYDATTDVGIPTFYSIDVTPENKRLGQLVMCNTSLDPVDSVAKMLRESASSRIAMQAGHAIPDDINEFTSVFHGAGYMADPRRVDSFDFIRNTTSERNLSSIESLCTGDPAKDVSLVVERLQAIGAEVIVVEITTDEARAAGFRVVRVLIPELMPLSFVHSGRYLAHPRLYTTPTRLGYESHSESHLNPLPQPFA